MIILFCANFGIRKINLGEKFVFDQQQILCEFFEKLGVHMAFVLQVVCQLLGVEVYNFSHVVVRSGFSRSTSAPSCVELSTVCTIWSHTVVFLFNVSVKSRVR